MEIFKFFKSTFLTCLVVSISLFALIILFFLNDFPNMKNTIILNSIYITICTFFYAIIKKKGLIVKPNSIQDIFDIFYGIILSIVYISMLLSYNNSLFINFVGTLYILISVINIIYNFKSYETPYSIFNVFFFHLSIGFKFLLSGYNIFSINIGYEFLIIYYIYYVVTIRRVNNKSTHCIIFDETLNSSIIVTEGVITYNLITGLRIIKKKKKIYISKSNFDYLSIEELYFCCAISKFNLIKRLINDKIILILSFIVLIGITYMLCIYELGESDLLILSLIISTFLYIFWKRLLYTYFHDIAVKLKKHNVQIERYEEILNRFDSIKGKWFTKRTIQKVKYYLDLEVSY